MFAVSELPIIGAERSELQTGMIAQIFRVQRRSSLLEIRRAGNRDPFRNSDFPRDQARIAQFSRAHRNIHALGDKIDIARRKYEFDIHRRIFFPER